MADIFSKYIYLIIALPALIFLILILSRFFAVEINRKLIGFITVAVSALNTLLLVRLYKLFAYETIYENTFPLIKINDFVIPFGIYADKTGLIFGVVLFFVSFLVQLFSISYMRNRSEQYRFFALINLFTSFLAALFFSPNLFQTYVFWELAGVLSYLLIGFEYNNPDKSLASKKVFIMNRIGDTAFLAGIVICSYYVYKYTPLKALAALPLDSVNTITSLLNSAASKQILIILGILFLVASLVKSAQFPFYTWLQDAMEAKLPVSALLHSATLVALGVYLNIRLFPFYQTNPFLMKLIMLLGLISVVLCSLFACVQNNPKKVLAYSTSAQLGLMFFAIGMMNIKAAIILFVSHALIKPLLFLTLPENGKKWNFTKFVLFSIGGLSISGVLLSGMIAKEMLVQGLDSVNIIIVSAASFLTAFYLFRILLKLFKENGLTKNENDILENFSLIIFLLSNIILSFYLKKICEYQISAPFLSAICGLAVVFLLYKRNAFYKVPYMHSILYNGLYLDKFYMTVILSIYNKLSFWFSKFDTEILGNYKPLILTTGFMIKFVNWIEINIMNKSVFIVADIARRISAIGKQLQTKNVQSYNFYGFIIITAILSTLVVAYSATITYMRGVY